MRVSRRIVLATDVQGVTRGGWQGNRPPHYLSHHHYLHSYLHQEMARKTALGHLLPQNHHKDKEKTISSPQEQLTPPPAAVALLKTTTGPEGERQSDEAEQLSLPTTWQLGDPQLKRSRQDQTKARRALEVS